MYLTKTFLYKFYLFIVDADVSATDEGQYYTVGQQVIATGGSQTATARNQHGWFWFSY